MQNVFLKPVSKSAPISKDLDNNSALKIPIAHGEGRFFAAGDVLKSLQDHDQILFQYCNELASVEDNSNPNGSILNIAGITNKRKNVFGMMPHPERAADEKLLNIDGKLLFESILNHC